MSVRLIVRPSYFSVHFLSPLLFLLYLMQGFETFNTVQTCTEHIQIFGFSGNQTRDRYISSAKWATGVLCPKAAYWMANIVDPVQTAHLISCLIRVYNISYSICLNIQSSKRWLWVLWIWVSHFVNDDHDVEWFKLSVIKAIWMIKANIKEWCGIGAGMLWKFWRGNTGYMQMWKLNFP